MSPLATEKQNYELLIWQFSFCWICIALKVQCMASSGDVATNGSLHPFSLPFGAQFSNVLGNVLCCTQCRLQRLWLTSNTHHYRKNNSSSTLFRRLLQQRSAQGEWRKEEKNNRKIKVEGQTHTQTDSSQTCKSNREFLNMEVGEMMVATQESDFRRIFMQSPADNQNKVMVTWRRWVLQCLGSREMRNYFL